MTSSYNRRVSTRVLVDPEDEIVISGISGRFPNSDNLTEFAFNLYNKVDMVDDDERRWRHIDPEIPKRSGKINGIEKFDASFFSVHKRQAHAMDPQARLFIEHAYEAILDAGVNPKSLRESRTGVFMGGCFSETEEVCLFDKQVKDGLGLIG
jgi:fatty acid synthase, animal type